MTSRRKKNDEEFDPPMMRAILYPLSEEEGLSPIKLRRDATIFGREKGDLIIDDHEVSSMHCQIQMVGDSYLIFDMNSTNGTFVNSERILKSRLQPGDIITFGQTSFRFEPRDESSVKNISTMFKTQAKKNSLADTQKTSLVDTLIIAGTSKTLPNIILQIQYKDGSVEEIEMNQRIFFIGRASSFGKFEQDPEISRKHLLVKINSTGEVFIEDQGSTNGSFLNGKRISGMHLVTSNDEIKVGTSVIKIRTD